MTTPIICSNCGAMLIKQWWDWERRAYDCRACGYLTGPEGQRLGTVTRSRVNRRLILFLAVMVAALVLAFLFVPEIQELI